MLIVEDGTGMTTSEAYRSIANHKLYMDNRGLSYVGLTDLQLEQHSRLATDYLTSVYRDRWAGSRTSLTQALDWPRFMVPLQDVPGGYSTYPAFYPSTSVPAQVASAQSELMRRLATLGDLAPDLTRGISKEVVGPIEITYDPYGFLITRYRAVDDLLKPLLRNGGGSAMVRVVRG